MSGKLPPSRPGGSTLGSPGRGGLGGLGNAPTASSGSPNRGSSESARPPVFLAVLLAVNLLVPIAILGVFGIEGGIYAHAVGLVFGMFGGVILLGLFRQALNRRRANGRFADWRVSSSRFAAITTGAAWILGAANLFIVCYELSRGFTE